MIKVKICGITNKEDALYAAGCGANALGFIFYEKSPRYIEPDDAKTIIAALPPFVTTVGVFVNKDFNDIRDITLLTGVTVVQLHGDESPSYCNLVEGKLIKAIRVKNDSSIEGLKKYDVDTFLLDSFDKNSFGGSGLTFDWKLAEKAKQYGKIILAGGLTPDNVEEAVKKVAPYGVDVNSGVEKKPGIKNKNKVKEFIIRSKAVG
ncbi:MAG TPA: phosphoribosylanthranilate isomerase [Nitrospinota bacterium]|jgi:phosphoribosylanthranilate isomerase|nr:phosphoribosylanthranilate isomerase [Nitrospinota bacterium]